MKMIINGKYTDAVGGKTIDNINPFNGELINKIPLAEKADYEIAVQAARKAQPEWYQAPLQERMDILSRFVDLVRKNKDDITKAMIAEGGKLIGEAKSEVDTFCTIFETCINVARRFFGSGAHNIETENSRGEALFTEHIPLGVFMIFIPSSFPVEHLAYRAAPAIAAGNAVILKPAVETSNSAIMLTELMHQAGMPVGVVQCVTGSDSVAREFLCETDEIDAVCISGNKAAAMGFLRENTSHFQRAFIDGGNNSPFIVLENAELEFAVEQAVSDRIFNGGQSDYVSKMFYVQKSISLEFLNMLIERLSRVKMGDPTDPSVNLGPLVSTEAAEHVIRQIDSAVSQGAVCPVGGERDGCFVAPTVVVGASAGIDFRGPVFSVTEFDTMDELIETLNSKKLGPVCRIYAKSIASAVKLSSRLRAESCVINGSGFFAGVQMPGTDDKYIKLGVKDYVFPFLEFTREKTVYINHDFPIS